MREELEFLFKNGDFDKILNQPSSLISDLYKCKVYLKTNKNKSSLTLAKELYSQDPNNVEIVQLLSQSLKNNGLPLEAIDILKKYIEKNNSESVLRGIIETLIENNKYDEASIYNDMRNVSKSHFEDSLCVAIQCFNKPELLKKTLSSLVNCSEKKDISVAILQDSHIGSNYKKNYESGHQETKEVINQYLPILHQSFSNVYILENKSNKGTAPSCRALLDFCFKAHNSVFFIEDDFILSPDALLWAKSLLKKEIGINNSYYFGSCESVFFDSKGASLDNESLNTLRKISKSPKISNKFVEESFVPSTCFITKREIWDVCSSIRGSIKGPESLNSWLVYNNKKTILPVLPRGYDIGMLDENGYSVAMLGKDNVKEIKSTYLASENKDLLEPVELYQESKDLIYSATSLLKKDSIEKLRKKLYE